MADTLGILVSTDKHLDYVVLTVEPDFAKLEGKAKIWICDVSFRSNGLHGREEEVPGVGFKDFVTQGRNAEMLAEVDRFVVL